MSQRNEFIKLIEAKIEQSKCTADVPFPLNEDEGKLYLSGKIDGLNWVLEMLPEWLSNETSF